MFHQVISRLAAAFALATLVVTATQAEEKPAKLLAEVKDTAEKEKTLLADFTYITKRPTAGEDVETKISGTLKLMKPNFADIHYNPKSAYGKRIIADGKTLWTINNGTGGYTQEPVDPEGKNINVWRLIIIGGFFDIDHWIRRGVYVGDLENLHYIGTEEIDGVKYKVLEHHMTGTIQGKDCPFHQKVFIGPEGLITRFTLDFTLDGKPGSEVAELKDIKLGEKMAAEDFQFISRESVVDESESAE